MIFYINIVGVFVMKERLGSAYIIFAACLWGMLGIFVREINVFGLSSMQIVALRALGATIILFLFMVIFKRDKLKIKPQDIWVFLGTGIGSMVFFNFCYFGSINRTSLAVAAALLYTAPAFVAVLARIILKEKVTTSQIISIIIVIIGCALASGIVTHGFNIDLLGFLLGLGSGLGYAMYSIFGKIAIKKGYSDETITLYTFFIAMIATGWTLGDDSLAEIDYNYGFVLSVLGLIVFSTVMAYLFYTKGLSMVKASKAAVLATFEPVVATLIGICLYHEKLTWDICLGVALIIFNHWGRNIVGFVVSSLVQRFLIN